MRGRKGGGLRRVAKTSTFWDRLKWAEVTWGMVLVRQWQFICRDGGAGNEEIAHRLNTLCHQAPPANRTTTTNIARNNQILNPLSSIDLPAGFFRGFWILTKYLRISRRYLLTDLGKTVRQEYSTGCRPVNTGRGRGRFFVDGMSIILKYNFCQTTKSTKCVHDKESVRARHVYTSAGDIYDHQSSCFLI